MVWLYQLFVTHPTVDLSKAEVMMYKKKLDMTPKIIIINAEIYVPFPNG